MIARLTLNAVALGSAYALVAAGFALVLNATSAVNFAHGDLAAAGGLLGAALAPLLPSPAPFLMLLVMVITGAAGCLICLVAYLPLARKPAVSVFVSTIAVGVMLRNGALTVFGPEPRTTPLLGSGAIEWAGLVAPERDLAVIAVAALSLGGLAWVFRRTQLGKRLRAVASDPETAAALGIPVKRMILVAFVVGSALAGTAGWMTADRHFVTPSSGDDLILKAYIATTIGGWGSIPGAVAGALLIALFEVLVSSVLSVVWANGALYLVLFLILIVRPEGLFGEEARRRV